MTAASRWLSRALLAALLALLAPGAPAAPAFGRLFTTPAERAHLDRLRREFKPPAPAAAHAAAPAPLPDISVGGVVLRSDGRGTAWINGVGVPAGEPIAQGIRVLPSRARGASVRILLPGSPKAIDLLPGQRIDLQTDKVSDILGPPAPVKKPAADAAVRSDGAARKQAP